MGIYSRSISQSHPPHLPCDEILIKLAEESLYLTSLLVKFYEDSIRLIGCIIFYTKAEYKLTFSSKGVALDKDNLTISLKSDNGILKLSYIQDHMVLTIAGTSYPIEDILELSVGCIEKRDTYYKSLNETCNAIICFIKINNILAPIINLNQ